MYFGTKYHYYDVKSTFSVWDKEKPFSLFHLQIIFLFFSIIDWSTFLQRKKAYLWRELYLDIVSFLLWIPFPSSFYSQRFWLFSPSKTIVKPPPPSLSPQYLHTLSSLLHVLIDSKSLTTFFNARETLVYHI